LSQRLESNAPNESGGPGARYEAWEEVTESSEDRSELEPSKARVSDDVMTGGRPQGRWPTESSKDLSEFEASKAWIRGRPPGDDRGYRSLGVGGRPQGKAPLQ